MHSSSDVEKDWKEIILLLEGPLDYAGIIRCEYQGMMGSFLRKMSGNGRMGEKVGLSSM